MRVIAGKYKGHRLVSFKAQHLRPTTDRVKESIFNKFQVDIPGAKVLDLFAGTGSLSIESLSRGAEVVLAVESHPQSLKIIKENLNKLKISDGIELVSQDVFIFLKKYSDDPFDVILIDPPFTQKIADQVMLALAASLAFKPGTLVVIESTKHEKIQDLYQSFVLIDRKDYGDKLVSFFESQGS